MFTPRLSADCPATFANNTTAHACVGMAAAVLLLSCAAITAHAQPQSPVFTTIHNFNPNCYASITCDGYEPSYVVIGSGGVLYGPIVNVNSGIFAL